MEAVNADESYSRQPLDNARRIVDCLVALVLLLITAPLLLIIALIIKLDSDGPVFFRQPRVGYNSEVFLIWKFRTMRHTSADINGSRLTERNDPRITRIGARLRATSLDEIPQLFNVLTGHMALVGPRPHPIDAKADGRRYAEVVHNYEARHRVRPGITGWAQVNGWRGETTTVRQIEQRVAYDLEYIVRRSLFFDVFIILLTLRELWRQDAI